MIEHLDLVGRREPRVSVDASEMVTIPRAELDSLRAEVRRLRRRPRLTYPSPPRNGDSQRHLPAVLSTSNFLLARKRAGTWQHG